MEQRMETAKEQIKLTLPQKLLFVVLCCLLLLMVVFSLLALRNLGQEGYDRCIQQKCAATGEAFCGKFREISNCCLGAGGKVGIDGSQYGCGFGE